MPGAPRDPDARSTRPDDHDPREVPILRGAGPILAILAMTLFALLSVHLTGTC